MSKNKKKSKNKGPRPVHVPNNKIGVKAATSSSEINPFEVKVNRSKHDILGRSKKHDRGLPGISRRKTFVKRKNTLLKEYQLQGKNNVFADKRIGEKDYTSNEEKATARLIAERSKRQKSSVFNLNEDEEITHLGVPVSEIEKCKEIPSDSESDDNLGADFVSKAHFGGFLTKKEESKSSHKDIINDLIAQSKQRKHEKQALKDVTLEMTESLDEKWKELRKLLPNKQQLKATLPGVSGTSSTDTFDTFVKKLRFEKLKPSERGSEKCIQEEQEVPASYKEFQQLMNGLVIEERLSVIEKILKYSQPENKKKLEQFFGIIMQYVQDLCDSDIVEFEFLDALMVYVHTIAAKFPVSSSEHFLNLIQTKHHQLQEQLSQQGGQKSAYPKFDTLMLLKLSSKLFSTPHPYHSVLTPCMLLMSKVLSQCTIKDVKSLVGGLFVCDSMLQCVGNSKQVVPEALTFLLDVICASVKTKTCHIQMLHPLPSLCINDTLPSDIDWTLPLSYMLQSDVALTNIIKAKIVKLALDISWQFALLYKNKTAFGELFEPFEKVTSDFLMQECPPELRESADRLVKQLQQKPQKIALTAQKKKPKMLRFFEPKIGNSGGKQKAKQESKNILAPRYKQELKGAVREVRRDNAFLARHMLQEQIERDEERKRKVNKLYQELAEQEGSFRALTKKKK